MIHPSLKDYKLLKMLIRIIGLFDPYGIRHSERVAAMVRELAIELGMDDDSPEMAELMLGTLLHDIGKIGIPESIRRMPGRYTDPERIIMQQHAKIGFEFLLWMIDGGERDGARLIAKYHHEDWSGTGYPEGLKGEQIPYGARLVRVCDTFDALTHERGYQRALTTNDAIRIMTDQQIQNTWAEPRILEAFIMMIKRTNSKAW